MSLAKPQRTWSFMPAFSGIPLCVLGVFARDFIPVGPAPRAGQRTSEPCRASPSKARPAAPLKPTTPLRREQRQEPHGRQRMCPLGLPDNSGRSQAGAHGRSPPRLLAPQGLDARSFLFPHAQAASNSAVDPVNKNVVADGSGTATRLDQEPLLIHISPLSTANPASKYVGDGSPVKASQTDELPTSGVAPAMYLSSPFRK